MKDRLLAIVVMAGALVYLVADWRMPAVIVGDPLGPKVFPAIIGVGLLLSGLLLLLESRGATRSGAEPADPAEHRHRIVLLGIAAWTAIYYMAFEPVGYLISTVVYMLVLLAYFNRGRHVVNVAVALCFTAVAYGVFARFLGVAMPMGLLGS